MAKISETRIYSEALTATEISNLHTYGRNPDATNLEGWWEFDGDATDSTANGNDGTVSGAVNTTDPLDLPPCLPWPSVCLKGAYDFDGVNDYIDTAVLLSTSDSTAPMTVSCWIKTSDSDSGAFFGQYIQIDSGRFAGYVSSGKVRYFKAGTVAESTTSVDDGAWHMVTFSKSGSGAGQASLYIDGVSEDTGIDSVAFSNNDFRIGHWGDVASTYFDGLIADVRVYSEALTASEIGDLYAYGRNPEAANLEAWYEMDGDATDSTANGNDGTVSGAVNTTDPLDLPPCLPWPSVCLKGAYDFDGVDDEITIADDDSLSFGDNVTTDDPFTISAWVNMDDATLFTLFGKGADATREYFLILNGSDEILFRAYDTSTRWIERLSDVAYTSLEGGWAHIVATYDGSSANSGMTLYVNGSSIASTGGGSGVYSAMHNFGGAVIGRLSTDNGNFADGKISDVRIYREELTATEISDLYTYGRNPDAPTLEGWWEFDGGDATDSTANGNDGTVTGAVNTTDPADLPGCAPR